MTHECRIYDDRGKLKKIIDPLDVQKQVDQKIFGQKSTQNAQAAILRFKNEKEPVLRATFKSSFCVYCREEFYPRYRSTRYCSHECQKRFYYEKRKRGLKTEPTV